MWLFLTQMICGQKINLKPKLVSWKKQAGFHILYHIINEKNQVISERKAKSVITFDELIKSCDIGLSTVVII